MLAPEDDRRRGLPQMRNRDKYQRIANFYDFLDAPFERKRYRKIRQYLCKNISGYTLDAGTGTGQNLTFLSQSSTMTVALDLSSAMLSKARGRTLNYHNVQFVESDIVKAPFRDNTFDNVICSFLFCVLKPQEQITALKEICRICKPQGEIRLLDYCYSKHFIKRMGMYLWAPWVKWAYGAEFNSQTQSYLDTAGLKEITYQYVYKDIIRLLVAKPKA